MPATWQRKLCWARGFTEQGVSENPHKTLCPHIGFTLGGKGFLAWAGGLTRSSSYESCELTGHAARAGVPPRALGLVQEGETFSAQSEAFLRVWVQRGELAHPRDTPGESWGARRSWGCSHPQCFHPGMGPASFESCCEDEMNAWEDGHRRRRVCGC